jgi:phosphoribosylcarboxyaminoimidazole (NCAIR) mutase
MDIPNQTAADAANADVASAGQGGTAPPPAQTGAAAGAVTTPPAGSPRTPRTLASDEVIQLPDGRMGTVAQLAEAAGRALTPEQLAEFGEFNKNRDLFNTFRGIQAGDKDAILKVFNLEDKAPEAVDPATEVAQLRQTVQELQSAVRQMNPTYEQIEALRTQNEMSQAIAHHAAHLPALSLALTKDPTIGRVVLNNLELFKNVLVAQNQRNPEVKTWGQLNKQEQEAAKAQVVMATEQQFSKIAGVFGAKITPPGASSNPGVTDDQIGKRDAGGSGPRLRLVGNQLVDETGTPYVQTADGRMVPARIDTHIPSTSTAGSAVPAMGSTGQRRRQTVEELQAELRGVVQAATGAQQ